MVDYKYKVKEGDTLSELSERFYGAMKYYPSIADHNRIKNPDLILVDQIIEMPGILKNKPEESEGASTLKLVLRRRTEETLKTIHSTFVPRKLREVAQQMSQNEFILWASGIFGFHIPKETYKRFRQKTISNRLVTPEVQILDRSAPELANNNASYDVNLAVVYIAQDIIGEARGTSDGKSKLLIALCEEWGHHLDAYIRKSASITEDTPKDEGANFAYHILGSLCGRNDSEVFAENAGSGETFTIDYKLLQSTFDEWLSPERILADHKFRQFSYQTGALTVDDVVDEMPGQSVKLDAAHGSLSSGTAVVINSWVQTNADVTVHSGTTTFSVPKVLLSPIAPTAGLRYYAVGLSGQRAAVNSALRQVNAQQIKVDQWMSKESQYISNRIYWQNSRATLEAELARRINVYETKAIVLSRVLMREVMYNRFDFEIKRWTDHYNANLSPASPLDANVPKSMFFEETRFGCSGVHLLLPPYNWTDIDRIAIKSRYNLGQAIDSWAPQHYLMIKEMSPSIYSSYNLSQLETQLRWKGMTHSDYVNWNGGAFWTATIEFHGTMVGGNNLMGTPRRQLYEDYTFWIRTAIRWLFLKFFDTGGASWETAVKAYNGSGSMAEGYKNRVISRVSGSGPVDASM